MGEKIQKTDYRIVRQAKQSREVESHTCEHEGHPRLSGPPGEKTNGRSNDNGADTSKEISRLFPYGPSSRRPEHAGTAPRNPAPATDCGLSRADRG